jgi:hypothetical protein
MNRLCPAAFALAAACLTVGCFPVRFTRSPGVSGVVLDSQTRAPVCGAKAILSPVRYAPNLIDAGSVQSIAAQPGTARRLPAVADQNGHFLLPPLREWAWWNCFYFPLEDLKERGGILILYGEGYEPVSRSIDTKRKRLRLSEPLLLQPVTK